MLPHNHPHRSSLLLQQQALSCFDCCVTPINPKPNQSPPAPQPPAASATATGYSSCCRRLLLDGDAPALADNISCDVHGLLCYVGVLLALVDLEVQPDLAAQAALGQHALHSVLNDALRQTLRGAKEGRTMSGYRGGDGGEWWWKERDRGSRAEGQQQGQQEARQGQHTTNEERTGQTVQNASNLVLKPLL